MATFCLLHGAWHDATCWEPLVQALRRRGHEALAPDLPLDDPEAGFEERAGPAVAGLEGAYGGGGVVVVGHSAASGYAAMVAVEHPGSLLVYLCPRLGQLKPPPGAPVAFREGFPFPADRPDGTSVWEPDAAIAAMYPRLAADVARSSTHRLRPLASPPGEYPLDGHPDVPTALIYATDDEFFDPAWERLMARELLGIDPIEIPGGHFPMLEDPDALAGLLDRLAREHGQR